MTIFNTKKNINNILIFKSSLKNQGIGTENNTIKTRIYNQPIHSYNFQICNIIQHLDVKKRRRTSSIIQ